MITMRVKSSIVIRRPVAEVFDLVATGYFQYARRFGSPEDLAAIVQFPDDPASVGSHGYARSADTRGFILDTDIVVTEYVPMSRFAVKVTTTYADDQPNKTPPARYAKSATTALTTCIFAPAGSFTLLKMETTYQLDLSIGNWMYVPVWSGRYRRHLDQRLVLLRDRLEADAGLKPRKWHIRELRALVGWAAYGVVLATLLWINAAQNALGLSHQLVDVLRTTLALLIVGAFMFVILTKTYFR